MARTNANPLFSILPAFSKVKRLPISLKQTARVLAILFGIAAPPCLAQGPVIPNFWDPHLRIDKPDLSGAGPVRILTSDDYPPFSMPGFDGTPTGFSVELARKACLRLQIVCTIQIRPFDTLLDDLSAKRGDVIITTPTVTEQLRGQFAVTRPYFKDPGRFIVRSGSVKSSGIEEPPSSSDVWSKKTIAVVSGSTHEIYLRTFFKTATIVPFADANLAQKALKSGETDFLFGSGTDMALWINGSDAGKCCVFFGAPYLESRYFGEGFTFIIRDGNDRLRQAFDYAFQQLWLEGAYAELYLRFFPVGPY